ncbi:Six-hairpin glycosidase [Bimuria novae-zelandiae CBS 107.79]|uniref:Six-hairpin glycosidase n=1 Tax=Bimuria novae-zelandiae CBS 107.79 TaxID=1447943 RepID=A0A6A5VG24_9PLEO|nr:Six-hairpin glycosidase [Bimuria novae-zelandiae CBS 107.79]
MLLKPFARLAFIAALTEISYCSAIFADISNPQLEAAYGALQQWYNSSNGLWVPSTGWWNSANCLTVIAGVATVDDRLEQQIAGVISKTYSKAPKWNAEMTKVVGVKDEPYLMQTYYGDQWPYLPPQYLKQHGKPLRQNFTGFLNSDEGWWALGWIAAYDLTNNQEYLSQAQAIFKDMYSVFGKTNCSKNDDGIGGIWWDKNHTYVNAIANELFFSTAASLANRVPPSYWTPPYLGIAKQQLAWFQGSGMIGANFTINDGLDQQTCRNNGGTIWTYNQGVILGGLVELSKATGDTSYIDTAHKIAEAAIATLAPSGILKDPCEPTGTCGADGSQFKGILVRNMLILHKVNPKDVYRDFFRRNAKSIWENDRNEWNQLSISWAGPLDPAYPANASTQSSAMDCLVAAVAVA